MPNRKPRILIIDNDKGFCRLVSKHLKLSGFEAACAHCANEGLASAVSESVDVIVLDHGLPEENGIGLLSVLKGRQKAPPVIYLTANQDSRVAVAALKAGAADYLVKDLHGDFLLLLENAVTNAMFASAIKRDKEKAEAEVRAARDQFQALAEERALLLREVSHRVGNSLQLIASLLHFQGDISGNEDVKAALQEANSRVLAVARVHRLLYTSLDVRWISLADYLSNLIDDLQDATAGSAGEKSSISFSSDPIRAGPDTAVALGIVAAELILNALKHAYPGGRGGPVTVSLRAYGPNAELIVEDSGIGGLNGAKNGRQRGLGQRIIAGMADKLSGTFRYEPMDRGTRAILTFPAGDDIEVLSTKKGNAA
jgi:two-component sensor histidine kinase